MTVIYTIWLVVAGLLWLYFLFLERKKIRDHIFKPKVESMDDLGAYTQKIINVGLGFPSAAITWPLWIPVLVLMMGTSLLWDDYLKPYLDAKLFPPKAAAKGPGSITIMTGVAGQGKEVDLKGTTYDNRRPEEKGKQTISTTGDLGGSLTLVGGSGGTGTLSPEGTDLFLNKVEETDSALATKGAKAVGDSIREKIKEADPAKNFEETKEDQEDSPSEPEKKEDPKPEKDDSHENTDELDVSQTAKDEDPKEK